MFYRHVGGAVLHININPQEQSKDIIDSHIMVCLLAAILPLTVSNTTGIKKHLQCQRLRGERLSKVIKRCDGPMREMSMAKASQASGQCITCSTSTTNRRQLPSNTCRSERVNKVTNVNRDSASAERNTPTPRVSSSVCQKWPKTLWRTDYTTSALCGLLFPIPVTLETVVHVGRSNSISGWASQQI